MKVKSVFLSPSSKNRARLVSEQTRFTQRTLLLTVMKTGGQSALQMFTRKPFRLLGPWTNPH